MSVSESANRILRDAHVLRAPVGPGQGYWTGAPGVCYARDEQAFYVTYRIRRPRLPAALAKAGGAPPDRGGEARIARSTDLTHFDDVWSVTKDAYDSPSIERSAIRKGPDGAWRYFTSFVDPADGRWCVSVLKHSDVCRFDPSTAQRLFTARPLGLEGVKDPWIFEDGGVYYMMLSVALRSDQTREESHATLDIFNTGDCISATGLARSRDLDAWEWLGVVFAPSASGWDAYCRRINSLARHDGKHVAFYDGSASHLENDEEKTGLALSSDLQAWTTLTARGPALTSPHASGSLRYLDTVATDECTWAFYEFARPDGAHDLRVARIDLSQLPISAGADPRARIDGE
ncbi:MAG: hypothetical protein GEU99_16465 [Luteitalea sp.]|nr:hypothetical protein [Luteitalea sp.]